VNNMWFSYLFPDHLDSGAIFGRVICMMDICLPGFEPTSGTMYYYVNNMRFSHLYPANFTYNNNMNVSAVSYVAIYIYERDIPIINI